MGEIMCGYYTVSFIFKWNALLTFFLILRKIFYIFIINKNTLDYYDYALCK